MGQDDGIKIRALPRKEVKDSKPEEPSAAPRRWIIYVGTASCLILGVAIFAPNNTKQTVATKPAAPLATQPSRKYDSVNRHLQEAALKHEMMVRVRELENIKTKQVTNDSYEMDIYDSEDKEKLASGVQLDQENTSDRLYADLNDDAESNGYNNSNLLPADMINARIANRRWVNELERAERVQFVRNYIRSWAERGYEVHINQDLIVVGVTKLNPNKKLNINQVMDRLAQKGL